MPSPAGPSAAAQNRALPAGTVTFLFADIEGSTRLLERLENPAWYTKALEDYRRILGAAIEAAGGRIVSTPGDSVFAVFSRARDAVAASIHAQQAIRAHRWPDGSLAVRMGLHTGEPTLVGGDYVGLDVHRAARICMAAHGGQILLSQMSSALVVNDVPEGAALQDLGPHRLTDLQRPEHLYQVRHRDLPAVFPPVRALDARRHNLPIQLTSFVGRTEEIAAVARLLSSGLLVTLIGPGGAGKTRLALQVAAELVELYGHGVWFVDLAGVGDGGLLPQAIAEALRISEEPGALVRAGSATRDRMLGTLTDYLAPRHILLLLDNCEHVVAAAARVAKALLQAAPGLRILATSREALRVDGELTWPVGSLSFPEARDEQSEEALHRYSAVRLFVERAMAASPTFVLTSSNGAAVARICRRLDGIPLAIELAAARLRVLSPEQIESRLDDRFRLLTNGYRTALPHQKTLQATMDWSYDLLDPAEQTLFRRLAVFAGGFSLEASESMCSGGEIDAARVLDLLAKLVDRSLVAVEEIAVESRYRLLETVRQYSLEKLRDSGEELRLRRRHRDWCVALAEDAEPELHGPRQREWLERLDREYDNLRGAMEWSLANSEADEGLRLAGPLWWFWHVRGHFTAGRDWSERALAQGKAATLAARAKVSRAAGLLAWAQSDYARAAALGTESLELSRQAGDRRGAATALTLLGLVAHRRGEHDCAFALYEDSLRICRETGDTWTEAMNLMFLGEVSLHWQTYERADAFHRDALNLFRQMGDTTGLAYGLYQSGLAARARGDFADAARLLEQGLALFREMGNKGGIVFSLTTLGRLATIRREFPRATALLEQSLELSRELGYKSGIAYSLLQLGLAARYRGDASQAAIHLRGALTAQRDLGNHRGIVECLMHLGAAAAANRDNIRSARLFCAAYDMAGIDVAHDAVPSDEFADVVRAVRASLTGPEFEAAMGWSKTSGPDQVIAYAAADADE